MDKEITYSEKQNTNKNTNTNTNTKTKNNKNWITIILISLAYMVVIMNIQGIKALLPFIEGEFSITRAEAGLYSAFYFSSATLISIFSGRIVDSLDSKKSLLLGVGSVSIFIILHAFSPMFFFLLILAFFSGFGFSIVTPAVSKGVINIVPKEKIAFSLGITQSGASVGAVLGAAALPVIASFYDWRTTLIISGLFTAFVALLIFKFYHNDSKNENGEPETKTEQDNNEEKTTFKQDVLTLLRNKYLLWVCMIGMMFGFCISSSATHLPLFLKHDIGFSPILAGIGLAVFNIGGVAAHISWGYANDNILNGNSRLTMIIVGLLTAFTALIIGASVIFFEIGQAYALTMTFILGFTILGLPALYLTAVGEAVEGKLLGTATGLILMLVRVGNVISPPLFGLLADIRGDYSLSWVILGTIVLIITASFAIFTKND